jgi:hypothetical protein
VDLRVELAGELRHITGSAFSGRTSGPAPFFNGFAVIAGA